MGDGNECRGGDGRDRRDARDDLEIDAGLTYIDNEPLGRVRAVPLYLEQYRLLTSETSPLGAVARPPAGLRRHRLLWKQTS